MLLDLLTLEFVSTVNSMLYKCFLPLSHPSLHSADSSKSILQFLHIKGEITVERYNINNNSYLKEIQC